MLLRNIFFGPTVNWIVFGDSAVFFVSDSQYLIVNYGHWANKGSLKAQCRTGHKAGDLSGKNVLSCLTYQRKQNGSVEWAL